VWDVSVQVSGTWCRAKGEAEDSCAYGQAFSFDWEKVEESEEEEETTERIGIH
jgi:hypothetical protein